MSSVPLNIDFQQILLHLLNFAILFAVIYFLLYKPVKNFMDKRKQEYQEMDDAAHAKLQEADQLKASYEDKLKDVQEEIKAMKSEAAREAGERSAELENKARQQAEDILNKARQQAETEKDKIIEEAGDSLAKLAKDAAKKAVFESTSDAYDQFLKTVDEQGKD